MKRLFDVASSIYGLVVLSPIPLITALLIKMESPGPAIFRQKRPTISSELFDIYKFRSMKIDTPDVTTDLVDSTSYITKTGKIIHKTFIDELSQLLNVLKGEMLIVDPRPALYNQYELTEKRTKASMHTIRPGVAELAQVMGRDDITDDQKVTYDHYHLTHQSMVLDMYIIYKTIKNIVASEGVYH